MSNKKKKKNSDDNKNRRRIIILIIIIIILLLLTSCTIQKFGKIGRYDKTANTKIKIDTNEMEKIKNKNLYFDINYDKYLEINLSDKAYKVSYSIKGINPKKYSCTTSDSKIATCRVKEGYIEIIPKKVGKINVVLSTTVNGKKYIATLSTKIVRGTGEKSTDSSNSNSRGNNNKKHISKSNNKGTSSNNNTNGNGTGSIIITPPEVEKNKDARLKKLTVGDYNLIPTFDKDTYNYIVNVDSSVTNVRVSATPNNEKGKIVSGTGKINLVGDTTVIKITVRAEDGNEKDYKITVNKKYEGVALDNNNNLQMLIVSGHSITPSFSSNNTNYALDIPYEETKLNISYKTSSEKSVANIYNNHDFKVGINTVIVRVTAEDGSTKDYTISVNRLNKKISDSSKLSNLIISGHNGEYSFDPNNYNYAINVDSNTDKLNITATAEKITSTVEIINNKDFKGGINVVEIKVTAADGSTSTYNIIVNRALDTNNKLSDLKVKDYSLDQVFNPNVNEYNVTVPCNVDAVDIQYTKVDEREKVEITGNTNLVTGNNIVEVKVTSESGDTYTYKINVLKEEDLNDFYINSSTFYEADYNTNLSNYKDIIIDSNILEGLENKDIDNQDIELNDDELVLTDDNGSNIKIEGSNLKFGLKKNEDNQYVIRVSYDSNSIGQRTITVTGTRKGREVKNYEIKFNVVEKYRVILDAKTNGGFFNEFSDLYEIYVTKNETFNLNDYNKSYKLSTNENCKTFKFIGYDEDETTTSVEDLDYKVDSLGEISITNDITLYAIFSSTETENYESSNRLYLTDVDIFELENGTKEKIYPGAKGSYVMTIKNTTDKKITLKKLIIEEDNICITSDNCLNMGYIVKHTDNTMSNYQYPLGSENDYSIINNNSGYINPDNTYHNKKDVNLNDIVINPGETKEISLLWKWVDNDNDTEIGDYVNDHNDTYYLTVSYEFEKKNNDC